MKLKYSYSCEPLGDITLVEEDGNLLELEFGKRPKREEETEVEGTCIKEAYYQLLEYVKGERQVFTIPLHPTGTPFQKAVWKALQEIPYGETRSYLEIAKAVGNEKACRAVGMANHVNPIAIIVPCHRVIGKNGTLTGYGGGLPIKERLLALEQKYKKK